MVSGFDHALSLKANKVAVDSVHKEVHDMFSKRVGELGREQVDTLVQLGKEYQQLLDRQTECETSVMALLDRVKLVDVLRVE